MAEATPSPPPVPVGIYTAAVVGSRVRVSKIPTDSFAENVIDDRPGSVEVIGGNKVQCNDRQFGPQRSTGASEKIGGGFDNVYGSTASLEEIFSGAGAWVLKNAVDDRIANGCLLCFGSSNTPKDKSWESFSEQAIRQVLHLLAAKKTNFYIQCSMYEILDEVVRDLLNENNINLSVGDDDVTGTTLHGLEKSESLSDESDLVKTFRTGIRVRSTNNTDNGPASNYASTVFQMDIYRDSLSIGSTGNASSNKKVRSRLTIINVAGTEKLGFPDVQMLYRREGHTLSKSVVMLGNVVDELIKINPRNRKPIYEASKLTHCLVDQLGGSCYPAAIGFASTGDMNNHSVAAMELLEKLASVTNHPIGMDTNISMTLQIITLKSELGHPILKGGSSMVGNGGSRHRGKLEEELRMERVNRTIIEERKLASDNQLADMAEKYGELVKDKLNDKAKIIQLTEDKFAADTTVLELKMKIQMLLRDKENEMEEMKTLMVRIENDVLERELKEETDQKTIFELKDKGEELHKTKIELAREFIKLKKTFVELNADYKAELDKNEEIGVELLQLVNIRNKLTREKSEMEKKTEQLERENRTFGEETAEAKQISEDLRTRLQAEQELTSHLKNEQQRKKLAEEKSIVAGDRDQFNRIRALEEELAGTKADLARALATKEMVEHEKDGDYTASQARINDQAALLRSTQRQLKASNDQLKKISGREQAAVAEGEKLRRELQRVEAQHRERIFALTLPTNSSLDKQREKGIGGISLNRSTEAESQNQSTTMLAEEERALVREVFNTYKAGDEAMFAEVCDLRKQRRNLTQQLHELETSYRTVWDTLNDLDATKAQQFSKEGSFFGGGYNSNSNSDRHGLLQAHGQIQDLQGALDQCQADLRQARAQVLLEKEKAVELSGSMQTELSTLQHAKATIAGELREMRKQREHLAEEIQTCLADRKSHTHMDADGSGNSQAFEAYKRKLIEAIDYAKKPSRDGGEAYAMAQVRDLREENRRLQSELRDVHTKASMETSSSASLVRENARLSQENDQLKKSAMSQKRNQKHNASEAEKRAVELLTEKTVIEEQLRTYEAMLRKKVQEYTSDLKRLQMHVDFWQRKALENGVPPSTRPPM